MELKEEMEMKGEMEMKEEMEVKDYKDKESLHNSFSGCLAN